MPATNKHGLSTLEREFRGLEKKDIRDCYDSKGHDMAAARRELRKLAARSASPATDTIVVRNRQATEQRREEVRQLYSAMENKSRKEREVLQEAIDEKVIAWNLPKATYYDLHGMSRQGAVRYAEQIVVDAEARNVTEIRFETGRGIHSRDNFPAIKVALMSHFKDRKGCSMSLQRKNDGIIVLNF